MLLLLSDATMSPVALKEQTDARLDQRMPLAPWARGCCTETGLGCLLHWWMKTR